MSEEISYESVSQDDTDLFNTYIVKMKAVLDDIQGKNIILDTKNDILEKKNKKLIETVQELEENLSASKAAVENALNDLEQLRQEHDRFRHSYDELATMHQGLKSDYDVKNADIQNYAAVINSKSDEILNLKNKIEELQKPVVSKKTTKVK